MKKITLFILAVACSQVLLAQCNSAVAEYPFSGNAYDNSGNNLNGTVSGASLVQDRFGSPNSAYHFDGVNDYIQVAHNALLNFGPNDDFSISLWVKPEVTQNSTDPVTDLITKWVDNGSGNAAYPFSIRLSTAFSAQTNGAVGVHRYDQSCSNHYYEYANSTPINDNQWHHVVMVKDGDSIRTYVDNVQEFVGFDITSCSTSNSEPMYIGNRGGSFNNPDYYGAIDDIGIYDCALSPAEVSNLFNSSCATPIAEYPFNGNANDVSGNSLNGTVNGATLVQDRFGTPNSAYHFDGVNDFVSVAHSALLNFGPNDDFSISLWMKPETSQLSGDGVVEIISKWTDNGSANPPYPFAIRYATQNAQNNTHGAVGVHRFDQSCSNHYFEYTNQRLINDAQWHHVVMVKDGDSIRTYIDNVQEIVGFDVTSCSTANTEPMYIGNRGGSFNNPDYYGAIDDIGIYDCALSPTEIGNIFTGLDELIENDDRTILYPNPGSELNIRAEQSVNTITIVDITGKEMMSKSLERHAANYSILTEGWAKGVYLVRLYTDNGVVVKKWIKE